MPNVIESKKCFVNLVKFVVYTYRQAKLINLAKDGYKYPLFFHKMFCETHPINTYLSLN